MLWRQGDVFIAACPEVPAGAVKQTHCVLAEGELTGHAHRVADADAAYLFHHAGRMYLTVARDEATVVHDEHGPIVLRRGHYRVWRQREFQPASQSLTTLVRD